MGLDSNTMGFGGDGVNIWCKNSLNHCQYSLDSIGFWGQSNLVWHCVTFVDSTLKVTCSNVNEIYVHSCMLITLIIYFSFVFSHHNACYGSYAQINHIKSLLTAYGHVTLHSESTQSWNCLVNIKDMLYEINVIINCKTHDQCTSLWQEKCYL